MEYPRLWVAFEPGCDVPSNQNGGIPSLRRNIMREIELTKGYKAQVDDEDYDYLMQWKWHANVGTHHVYAKRDVRKNRKVTSYLMHRVILKLADSELSVDHRDGIGLNNQRSNLRTCTHSENMQNKQSKKGSVSKYVGVGFDNRGHGRWRFYLHINGKLKMVYKTFHTEYEAAIARDHYILDNRLEFPRLNILTRP